MRGKGSENQMIARKKRSLNTEGKKRERKKEKWK